MTRTSRPAPRCGSENALARHPSHGTRVPRTRKIDAARARKHDSDPMKSPTAPNSELQGGSIDMKKTILFLAATEFAANAGASLVPGVYDPA